MEETFEVDTKNKQLRISDSSSNLTAKEDKPVVEEKTEFDVIINEVPTAKRLTVIKVIRSITSLGLKEAKDLIESLPKVVAQGVSKEKAEETKKLLEESGANVTIK